MRSLVFPGVTPTALRFDPETNWLAVRLTNFAHGRPTEFLAGTANLKGEPLSFSPTLLADAVKPIAKSTMERRFSRVAMAQF